MAGSVSRQLKHFVSGRAAHNALRLLANSDVALFCKELSSLRAQPFADCKRGTGIVEEEIQVQEAQYQSMILKSHTGSKTLPPKSAHRWTISSMGSKIYRRERQSFIPNIFFPFTGIKIPSLLCPRFAQPHLRPFEKFAGLPLAEAKVK